MVLALLDNWVLLGLLAAAAWALSCLIDVCFVGDGIYREPADGPLMAGLFCVLPLVVVGGGSDWFQAGWTVVSVATLAGVAYLLHVHFYFKALFLLNDAANAEIFNTLSVLFVPLLAFIALGERLAGIHYLAIALAGVGLVVLVGLQLSRLTGRVLIYLLISVLLISMTMVMQAWVLRATDYGTAVGLFSAAAFLAVLTVLALQPRRRRRVTSLCRRFGPLFVVVQMLEMGAVFGSQRATDLGPSVSLVALLESALPLFVMAFSWALVLMTRYWDGLTTLAVQSALSLQTAAAPSKLVSMLLILVAVLLAPQ